MNTRTKIVKIETLKRKIGQHRREKKPIAFTNGCFDILHFGHVCYLESAKRRNRILIVGLNSDTSVMKIKGPGRPINRQDRRAAVLAALACVDYVVIFNEDTPYRLIEKVQPDVLIKGADWKGQQIVGQDIVEARKGRIELIEYVANLSTTNLIKTMRNSGKKR